MYGTGLPPLSLWVSAPVLGWECGAASEQRAGGASASATQAASVLSLGSQPDWLAKISATQGSQIFKGSRCVS